MGADGSMIVAQDQESSVVWGMPGSVVEAGLADVIMGLDKIGSYLTEQLRTVGAARPVMGVA